MADKKLEKQVAEQKKAMAELGRAQSARTGQHYDEIDEVPLSEDAIETAQAIEEVSEAQQKELDKK